jgi:proteasome-associated ATPase
MMFSKTKDKQIEEQQQKIQDLELTIQDLEGKLRQRTSDDSPSVREEELPLDIRQLRAALVAAKAALAKQSELLRQLTAKPFAYTVVLRVVGYALTEDHFQDGTRVHVIDTTDRNYGKLGKVLDRIEDGYASVQFDDGDRGNYFVFGTRQDKIELKIIGHNSFALPEDYMPGTNVEVTNEDRAENGLQGKVALTVDGDGDILVEFPDGTSNYYYVGRKAQISPIGVQGGVAIVQHEGKTLELALPKDKHIEAGDTVKLSLMTMQIIDVVHDQSMFGEIGNIRRVVDHRGCEVDINGSTRLISPGKLFSAIEPGDRVVLDPSNSIVLNNLGKNDDRFSFTSDTNVSWDEIGGLEEAKQEMIEIIEYPYKYSDLYNHYGKNPVKGAMLYGPPGCGKTMLGKAAATALAQMHGQQIMSTGFIYIKGPEILDKFVGVPEGIIRGIFQRARKHKQTYGYPAVIFFDEAEAVLRKRGTGISSDIEGTIVPMFLTEMDGLEDSGALMIISTNRPDILDPAIVRDGRIDRKIKIGRPTPQAALDIFCMYLWDVPLNNGYSTQEVAILGRDELFSPRRVLYEIKLNDSRQLRLTLGQICNGAMIRGIVDKATSLALRRDRENDDCTGISKEDICCAIDRVFRENIDLNHDDELGEFVYDVRDRVVNIRKIRQAAA